MKLFLDYNVKCLFQLHQEANLENDFIREYLKSQQALFRQQIREAPTGQL
jgi:hypothetical protein